MPRSPSKHTNSRPYYGGGTWILKTDAKKQFGIGDADLMAIDPISVAANERCRSQKVTKYARNDVIRLSQALQVGLGLDIPINKGRETITKTDAINTYNVSGERLQAVLTPYKQMPSKYRGTTIVNIYYLSDVKALAQQGQNIRRIWREEKSGSSEPHASSSRAGLPPRPPRPLDPDEFDAWLDNLDREDVEYLMNRALHG